VPDSPGSLENYYTSSLIGGLNMEPETYMEKLLAVTREDIARAAGTLQLHTVYFLKGEGQ
jgi:predicted Zn-dependent peptidase